MRFSNPEPATQLSSGPRKRKKERILGLFFGFSISLKMRNSIYVNIFIFQDSLKVCVLSKEETDKILLGKFGWLIMDDLVDKLLGEFRPHLRDKLLENFPSAQIELGPLEKEAGEKPGWLSNWKARRSWQTPNDFLGKAMSGKLLEKVGFLRVIGKRSAMLTKLALRKLGGQKWGRGFWSCCNQSAEKKLEKFSRGWLELFLEVD